MGVREIVLMALAVGGAYWVYENYFHTGRQSYEEVQWQKNADAIRECVDREITFARISATAGVSSNEDGAEAACAERLSFYFEDGYWKSY